MRQYINAFTILFLVSFCATTTFADVDKTTLKKGVFNKKIRVEAYFGTRDFHHNLTFRITNNTDRPVNVSVDPGLIFVPDDTTQQNMVTLGEEMIALEAGATNELVVANFCGKSYGRCPQSGMNFTYWKQGDSNMLKTLAYARNEKVNFDLIQHAVWMYTNGHSLNSVYSNAHPAESEKFMKYLAEIRHQKMPELYKLIPCHFEPGQPMIYESEGKIVVPVNWPNEGYRHMYITIYKANGDVYRRVNADWVIDKNETTVLVEFNPLKDICGTYRLEARDDNNKIWYDKRLPIDFENRCM